MKKTKPKQKKKELSEAEALAVGIVIGAVAYAALKELFKRRDYGKKISQTG